MVNCLFNKIDFYQGFSEKKLEIKSCQISCCFCSVAKSCPTFCDPMDCSKPGFLSLTTSWSLPRFVAIQSVMPSNCLILSSVQSLSLVQLCNLMDCSNARLPCPSPTPGACSNKCSSSQWCHPTISFSVVLSSLAFSLSQHQGLFQGVSSSHQVARLLGFSFNISPSDEYSELISFRMDWLYLLAVQGTLKSLLRTPQFKSISSSALNFLWSPTLTSIHDYWKNHSFD